jgi:hypothetical protein
VASLATRWGPSSTTGSARGWRITARIAGCASTTRNSPARNGWWLRWGVWSLLLSWAPILGWFTVVAGAMRTPLWQFTVLVTVAKTGRFVFLGLDHPVCFGAGLGAKPALGLARNDEEARNGRENAAKPPLTLYLAAPRGFCAGVDRAIKIVEMALRKWGAPVYVRHEIVHNRFVVDALREQGAVFVEELDECPDDRPVIFSAHGVPKSVPAGAGAAHGLCRCHLPLVSKVHIEAERHHENGLQMVMIGHAGHPETEGTMGQLPEGEVLLVETVADVATLRSATPKSSPSSPRRRCRSMTRPASSRR